MSRCSNFTGMQYSKAFGKAADSKLYPVKGAVKASDKPAGTILSQDGKHGSTVKQGTSGNGDRKLRKQ